MNFDEVICKLYPQRAKGVESSKIPWNNPNYLFQVKYDGDRRLLYFTEDGVKNTSRSKSAENNLPVEKTDNVPHIRDLNINLHQTILDCEFVHPRGFQEGVRRILGCLPEKAIQRQKEWGLIEVRLFDVIAYNGKFLHDQPFHYRNNLLFGIYENHFKNIPFINLVEECHGNQEELQEKLTEIINNGGEGMVAKDINSKYRLSTEKCLSPLKNAWIKIKREFNGDFVIMGFEKAKIEYNGKTDLDKWQYWGIQETGKYIPYDKLPSKSPEELMNHGYMPVTKYHANNWIGGIIFGEYEDGILIERGTCSGMTESIREDISINPDKYIGKVIEVDAMERIKKTKALRQPVFKRFRDDKLPEDCQYNLQKG